MAFQWLQMRIQEERERRELRAKHLARLPSALEELHDQLAECVKAYTDTFRRFFRGHRDDAESHTR